MRGSGKPGENFLSGPTNFCLPNSGGKAGREKFSPNIFTILASPPTLITFTPTHLMTYAHKSYHFFFGLFSILICHHSTPGPGSLLLFLFFFQRDLLFLVVIILLIHLLFLVDFLVSDDIQFFYIITIKIII